MLRKAAVMQVRDVMTVRLVTVGPEVSVVAAAEQMLQHRVRGLPVVDVSNRLVGHITESDLLHRAELGTQRQPRGWLQGFVAKAELARDSSRAHGRLVGEVMSQPAVTVSPDTSLVEVATLLESRHFRAVPVVEGDRLVGIISRGDLMRALVAQRSPRHDEADRRIRDMILAEYAREPWGLRDRRNVIVSEGTVHLWGMVRNPEERTALRVAAEGVPDVRAVEDHLTMIGTERDPRLHTIEFPEAALPPP